MLDHEDAPALGRQVTQQLAERLGLGLVLARRRLVEEQQLRVAGQAPGQLEQPGDPGGDRVGPLVGVRRDPDALEQTVHVAARRPDQPEEPGVDVVGHPHVVADGQ